MKRTIIGLDSSTSEYQDQWIIEPYYQLFKSSDGEIDRYERQTRLLPYFHAALKQCLFVKCGDQGEVSSFGIKPYKPDKEMKECIWIFEEIPFR